MMLEDKWPIFGRHERAAEWLQVWSDLGRAPRTIDAYARGLAEYLLVCEREHIDPISANRAHVATFVRELTTRPGRRGANVVAIDSGSGLANATLQQRLVSVRLFYDFLIEEGLRESNPVGRGKYTPGGRFGGYQRGLVPRLTKLPWIPSDQQWLDVLTVARDEPVRNRVMIALAFDAALRREELCSLRADVLDPGPRTRGVRAEATKNGLERVGPYSAAPGVLLSGYLAHRATISRARGPLFLSESRRNHAQPLTLWTWSKVVRRLALAAELADTGWLGSPPRVSLDGKRAHHLPDPNEEQAEAVARVMGMRPGQLYLIQGPPGTGKTTAIVESIRRILGRHPHDSILYSSHSNDAVDTGQERLLGFSHVRQVRIAEPGKVPRRLRHTLVEGDDLEPYNLVAGTVNRLAIDSRLRFRVFDWLILDEANKVRSNEALALMPLAKRWVMIGDLNQLPPVMEEAAMTFKITGELDLLVRDGSLYGWIWDRVPATSRIMLPRQYRMREPIGKIVSDLFYDSKLIHESPHQRMPLPWPFDREVVWVDTGAQDEYRDAQKSVANEFEVALCKDITTIIRKRVRKSKLAVIAMYSSQVNRLVSALKGIVPADDVESVDAFEGRESDAVILSLVRSNDRAAIGFLIFNFPPASSFMGDCGAQLLGLLMGVITVEAAVKTTAVVSFVLPLILPGIVAGSIFTFSLTLGDFITPTLVGGAGSAFIGNIVYQEVGISNNVPFAAAFATVPLVVMGIYLLAARRLGAFEAL